MIYIHSVSSVSHQDSFGNKNLAAVLKPLDSDSKIYAPEYSEFIPANSIRRFSPILKMSLAAAKQSIINSEKEISGIAVGTSLGCLFDTEKFLIAFLKSKSDVISPTAFIQSTHNTIAGQISLEFKNHGYNITHTQNSLSFEVALLDAILFCKETSGNILVGAADETIDFLNLLRRSLLRSNLPLTSGATFMVLGSDVSHESIQIQDVYLNFNAKDSYTETTVFLERNGLSLSEMDLILVSGKDMCEVFPKSLDYTQYTGLYFTNSSFAMHIAFDKLKREGNHVLIVNELSHSKLGLILLSRNETQS
jgi:3-oxoacyl-[acyl-carrier-protein] synthase II